MPVSRHPILLWPTYSRKPAPCNSQALSMTTDQKPGVDTTINRGRGSGSGAGRDREPATPNHPRLAPKNPADSIAGQVSPPPSDRVILRLIFRSIIGGIYEADRVRCRHACGFAT